MKKIVCLLLIVIICLSLFGCDSDRMMETWTDFAEFDDMNFNLDEYVSYVTDNGGAVTLVEEKFSNFFDGIIPTECYSIDFADSANFIICVFDGVDSAKEAHVGIKNELLKFKVDRSSVQAIRIDNVIVWGLSYDNNRCIIDFAKDIGIPEDKIKLHKNNEFWLVLRRDTDKTAEEIISAMEEKGYTVISKEVYEDDDSELYLYSEIYIIASEDYSTVYQLNVFKGDAPKSYCYSTLRVMHDLYLIKENACHIYYSYGDEVSMFIMGVSAETRNFWDEIR